MEPATVRLRVVFEDRNMLCKSQRSSGLKRSWLLLKPQHRTVSDLASYLLQAFELENACPDGVVLSMDGYVLPPFESTRILKDKDIISVTKIKGVLSDTILLGDGRNSLELGIVERPVPTGLKLLANEEFAKETGVCESVPEGDEDNQSGDAPQVETTSAKNKASKKRKASKELRRPKSKKSKQTTTEKRPVAENIGDNVEKHELNASKIDGRSKDSSESLPCAKRSCVVEGNDKKLVDAFQTPGGTRKVPSRSARRKKAKRQRLKIVNREKKKETFQRSEIASKKQGKKWAVNKFSSCRRNGYRNPVLDSHGPSCMLNSEERLIPKGPLDFAKLAPYSSMPKVGDVIAYRLIELSSSWTPQLSSFRVGKVSRYYSNTKHIFLAPVPGYPIAFEEEADEGASKLLPDTSVYGEDGTLKISFLCLMDIRTVKLGNLHSRRVVTGVSRNGPSRYNTRANNGKTHFSFQENGDVWEKLSRALNANKAQISQEDGWGKKADWGRSSSTFKGLRHVTLGPTI